MEAQSKEELIAYIVQSWNELVAYVDQLPEASWTQSTDQRGWTVKDHVSHVTQWDVAIVRLFQDSTSMQETLDIPDNEWPSNYDAINERLRRRHLNDTITVIRTDRDSIWTDFLAVLEALTDGQLNAFARDQGINVDADDPISLHQFLVDHEGGHYSEHLGYIKRIVEQERKS